MFLKSKLPRRYGGQMCEGREGFIHVYNRGTGGDQGGVGEVE